MKKHLNEINNLNNIKNVIRLINKKYIASYIKTTLINLIENIESFPKTKIESTPTSLKVYDKYGLVLDLQLYKANIYCGYRPILSENPDDYNYLNVECELGKYTVNNVLENGNSDDTSEVVYKSEKYLYPHVYNYWGDSSKKIFTDTYNLEDCPTKYITHKVIKDKKSNTSKDYYEDHFRNEISQAEFNKLMDYKIKPEISFDNLIQYVYNNVDLDGIATVLIFFLSKIKELKLPADTKMQLINDLYRALQLDVSISKNINQEGLNIEFKAKDKADVLKYKSYLYQDNDIITFNMEFDGQMQNKRSCKSYELSSNNISSKVYTANMFYKHIDSPYQGWDLANSDGLERIYNGNKLTKIFSDIYPTPKNAQISTTFVFINEANEALIRYQEYPRIKTYRYFYAPKFRITNDRLNAEKEQPESYYLEEITEEEFKNRKNNKLVPKRKLF